MLWRWLQAFVRCGSDVYQPIGKPWLGEKQSRSPSKHHETILLAQGPKPAAKSANCPKEPFGNFGCLAVV